MSVLSQGTHVFFVDPAGGTPAVVQLKKVTALNPGSAPASQIDETTLEDLLYMQYRSGLRDPGQGSMSIRVDPREESHITLHGLSETSPPPTLKWAIGWSDGTEPPTLDVDDSLVLPDTRTWCVFDAYVGDFPFDFAGNTTVATEIAIQRAGGLEWTKKVIT
ncbi:major tail subunit [Halomonas phage QHHSV-1]|nr:major tail subunit [Halomonas phage QHHSV-1]